MNPHVLSMPEAPHFHNPFPSFSPPSRLLTPATGTARAYDMQAPMNTSRQSPGVQYVASPSMVPAMSYGQMSPPMSSQMMPNGTPGSARFSPSMGAADIAGGKPPPFPGFDGVAAGGSLAANGDIGASIYSSAQGKNAWETEGAGIFDPSGMPASPNRFGILSGAGVVPPFPQPQSPPPVPPVGWGTLESTQKKEDMGGGAGKRQVRKDMQFTAMYSAMLVQIVQRLWA